MSPRRRGREIALQVLYMLEWSKSGMDEAFSSFLTHFAKTPPSDETVDFARSRVLSVLDHADEIDLILADFAKNWRLDRMSAVDRNILRLGISEILFSPDIPAKVAINEAVEIAKHFGSPESFSFVNGILDSVLKKKEPA